MSFLQSQAFFLSRFYISVILDSLSLSFKLFFVGVSRFADNDLGPPSLEGFVSVDCVLHRLAKELYFIVYPANSTWGVIKGLMAANEVEWSFPLSNELPEGLSSPEERLGKCRRRQQLVCQVLLMCLG